MEKFIFTDNSEKSGKGALAFKIFVYAMLTLWAIIVLFPFYWMLLSSFR